MISKADKTSSVDTPESKRLFELLHGLPLAIAQAGAFLQESGMGIKAYLAFYEWKWSDLMESTHMTDAPLQESPEISVLTAWAISYQAIYEKHQQTANLLLLWSFLCSNGLWYGLFAEAYRNSAVAASMLSKWIGGIASSELAFNQAMRLVENYSLVERVDGTCYALHPIVHRWLYYYQGKQYASELGQLAAIVVGCAVPDSHTQGYLSLQRQLLPHAQSCLKWISRREEQGSRITNASESVFADFEGGEELIELANAVHRLGDLYRDQGKFLEAGQIYKQALHEKKETLGPTHSSTLYTVNILSDLYRLQGNLSEAEQMDKWALQSEEKELVDDDFTTSTLQGEFSDGISHFETLIEEGMSNQTNGSFIGETYDEDMLDNSSVSSHVTTAREKDGKAHIAYLLATDPELRILCSRVMGERKKADFVDTGHRLLKAFYLGLLGDAQTELQKQSVRLLKSRRGRMRISRDIIEITNSIDAQEAEGMRIAEQARLRKDRVANWTLELANISPDKNAQLLKSEQLGEHSMLGRIQGYRDKKSGHEGHDTDNENEDNLHELEEFFRSSRHFQVLLDGFKELLLPRPLRDVITSTSVELSNEEDASWVNYMKAWVEDYTMVNWNWWPLEPCMRPLNPNESRLIWHCVSGRTMPNYTKLILYRPAGHGFGKR
jgi:tetratricopeptide (TPR) repeat protein